MPETITESQPVYRSFRPGVDEPRQLVIIGATGELGRCVLRAALQLENGDNHTTVAGDDPKSHSTRLVYFRSIWATYHHTPPSQLRLPQTHSIPELHWVQLDTADRQAVAALLAPLQNSDAFATVVYCAAPKHGGAAGQGGPRIRRGLVDDVVAAGRASNASPHRCRFIAISTDQVFDGVPPHAPYCTTSATRPTNPYARYKVEMEDALKALRHPDLVIARTSLILSLGESPEEDGKAIAFLRDALTYDHPSPVTLFVDEPRNMSWAEDLGAALVEMALGVKRMGECVDATVPTVVHLTCAQTANRYQLAQLLARHVWNVSAETVARRVQPGLSSESGLQRPLDLTLEVSSMWETGLVSRTRLRSIEERFK
ncbi:hypothetical protein CDCA_CDCA11G3200 [Cyanidium caldarium]|uniref:RmlD-like substrate binding domain-containing protein n=1 Tax=Cyanidium caldarium TaxID=2771 RepID=A0AAV9IYK0_CYACA|nr:hypothetical protein CDCA_CDCA11G3200 [Cyanidium caldarium]